MGIFQSTQAEAAAPEEVVKAVETTPVEVAEVAPSPSETPCRWKNISKENETYMDDVKDYFNALVNTSMDEHKACFKHTVQKITNIFKEKTSDPKEGVESVVTLQTASKN